MVAKTKNFGTQCVSKKSRKRSSPMKQVSYICKILNMYINILMVETAKTIYFQERTSKPVGRVAKKFKLSLL